MATAKESEVLILSQPDLLSVEQLIHRIQLRCCRMGNLSVMPKERLVGIFRRVLLPLPQRFYRTNRRGKMLMARRAKAGLEGGRKRGIEDAGYSSGEGKISSREGLSHDRLKPPPDISKPHRIRLSSDSLGEKIRRTSEVSERIHIKDPRGQRDASKSRQSTSHSFRESPVKRPLSGTEKLTTEAKRQRQAIRWP